MEPIRIDIVPNNLGRVVFDVNVLTGDHKSFGSVRFKLDSGSDFTTVNCDDLYDLGYTREYLEKCPVHNITASTASEDTALSLQYISNVSMKFDDRELQGCRIFFALDTKLRSLFGSDILKYFNWKVNYDAGVFQMAEVKTKPSLSEGETPIHIYSLEPPSV